MLRLESMIAVAVLALLATPAVMARAADGAEPLVIGDTFTLDSKVLEEARRINVFTPTYYGTPFDAPLPVLYMPDGGRDEDFLHIAGLVQILSANGGMRPFLLVGIENTERRRDMTGPTKNPDDRRIAPRVGGSAAFRAFIRDELMPDIRGRYRVTDETAIVGESLAGLFVVETFLLDPELFDTYIAFDPSLWWNNEALVAGAGEKLRAKSSLAAVLYLATGSDAGLEPALMQLVSAVSEYPQVRVHYEVLRDETHATIYHPAALRAFRTVFAPPSEGPDTRRFRTFRILPAPVPARSSATSVRWWIWNRDCPRCRTPGGRRTHPRAGAAAHRPALRDRGLASRYRFPAAGDAAFRGAA